jgi:hypothetical protein
MEVTINKKKKYVVLSLKNIKNEPKPINEY